MCIPVICNTRTVATRSRAANDLGLDFGLVRHSERDGEKDKWPADNVAEDAVATSLVQCTVWPSELRLTSGAMILL
ncbi:Hypothetical protein SMAX5B_000674 [Scophthalmus maximus]|uniref:Uncharacterized protein n=1 Tax=Scophthalmus maximus TaxID=52904 RepID=A0A2U9B654_SCOMX|nr:Hypothetical protein SMAX5B_000674 [Scophthalmus maximus]